MSARNAARLPNRHAPIPQNARLRIFPPNREGLIDLDILARLNAAPTKDALVWIVSIKWIRRVHLIRFGFEWDFLMLNRQELRGVMDGAVAVIVVAHRAVE